MAGAKATGGAKSTANEAGLGVVGTWGFDPLDMWGQAMRSAGTARAPKTPIEFWMSMFPTAPAFGVRWVMWDILQGGNASSFAAAFGVVEEQPKVRKTVARETREKEALERTSLRSEEKPAAKKPLKVKGKAKAKPVKTQSVGAGAERVVVDVKALDKAAAPEAEAEAAALERVAVAPRAAPRRNAAVGRVEPEAPKTERKTPNLRIVTDAEIVDPAPQKPKGLLRKKPAKKSDLKKIKGVGPSLEGLLNDLGIYQFAQIAKFSEDELLWVDEHLPSFKGRVLRDDWKGQATALLAEEKK